MRKPGAAAAAHDFNNELTVILSSVANSIMSLEPGPPARPQLLDFLGSGRALYPHYFRPAGLQL
jgi:hypothetical protein